MPLEQFPEKEEVCIHTPPLNEFLPETVAFLGSRNKKPSAC